MTGPGRRLFPGAPVESPVADDGRMVTILLPAKNEAAGLRATLDALPLAALRAAGHEVEVVVADGHSTDTTRDIAAAWGARVVVQDGRGKGMGVRSALPHLRGAIVVMLDADGTYDAGAIPALVRAVEEGHDAVLGSRFRGRIEAGAMSATNRVGNRALSLLASALYGKRVTDVCTGMWAFRREALAGLPLTATHYELEVDLFAQSVRGGLRIAELPIAYGKRHGQSGLRSLRDGLAIARTLLARRVARRPR